MRWTVCPQAFTPDCCLPSILHSGYAGTSPALWSLASETFYFLYLVFDFEVESVCVCHPGLPCKPICHHFPWLRNRVRSCPCSHDDAICQLKCRAGGFNLGYW